MKRALLTQMRNEWRDNIWLLIELAIVTLVIWVISMLLVNYIKAYMEPMGVDYRGVYTTHIKIVPMESPEYDGEEWVTTEETAQGKRSLIARLREKPYVEAAAFSSNGVPYNFNYYGTGYIPAGSEDSIGFQCNQRTVSPDMVRVLKFTGLNGMTAEELEGALRRGEVLLSSNRVYEQYRNVNDLIGKKVINTYSANAGAQEMKVGGLIQNIRRTEFEGSYAGTAIIPVDETNDSILGGQMWEIALRVKPGMEDQLKKDFREDLTMTRQKNIRLANLESLAQTRTSAQWNDMLQLRLITGGIIFLLFIIFLGLLGTFWFRVQQRTGEIAIRKVAGATSGNILRRLIGEVMILECVAMVIAIGLGWVCIHFSLLNVYFDSVSQLMEFVGISGAVALGLMTLAVILGVWFPARKAMRVEPAIALKDE